MQTNEIPQAAIIEQTKCWVNKFIIHYNICPFAEKFVGYHSLYGQREMWIRPVETFDEIIVRAGSTIKRLQLDEQSND
ncbi:MAG: DUF1415 family protein [Gammaproteobacteria bacterium]|nr:DUF1415 family protein [Gammaproteobacteria bacterium]